MRKAYLIIAATHAADRPWMLVSNYEDGPFVAYRDGIDGVLSALFLNMTPSYQALEFQCVEIFYRSIRMDYSATVTPIFGIPQTSPSKT